MQNSILIFLFFALEQKYTILVNSVQKINFQFKFKFGT